MFQPQSLIKGRYRVGRRLGEGGMATVYAGHDLDLGREVAIKTPRAQFAADPAFRARFAREARAAASLSHPNIIDIYDIGEERGQPFIVMELVRGKSLKSIITSEGPFHADDVAELLGQVGGALDYAHARGYVHRDIKPGNILVDENGRAHVVDFGIAKGLGEADLTESGAELGTAGYLSPEQAEGLMATPASDVYSAGVVAFEMLTGRLPFTAESPVGLAMRHINDPPPPPSRIQPAIPRQVDAVVMRALEKDPTRRWASAGAFAGALRDWRKGQAPPPVMARAPTEARAAPERGLAPTIVVALLVVVALATLLWFGFRDAPANREGGAPTVGVEMPPAITVAITDAEDPGTADAPAITLEANDSSALEPTAAAAEVAPTIAPVTTAAVLVPDLRGQGVGAATRALLPLGLRIALGQPEFSDTVPLNAVVSQDPPPGGSVALGTPVRVSLSRGRSPFGNATQP